MQLSSAIPRASWRCAAPETVDIPNTTLRLLKQSFGALSDDDTNPLSRISIANSSFSLDPFRGCPGGCAYCTVASVARDVDLVTRLNGNTRVALPVRPALLFTGAQLVDALVRHPAFIPHRSVVSIGTASTDPFLPGVESESWTIMQSFEERGLHNPFWMVTKLGIPDRIAGLWPSRIDRLRRAGIRVVVSVTCSGAPPWVEPYRGDRFTNLIPLKNAGALISHHLRPIIQGVNDSPECLRDALEQGRPIAENICVGALRRDLGVELTWSVIHGYDPFLLPVGRIKTLPDGYLDSVRNAAATSLGGIPVFLHSSEAISHLLGISDYCLHQYRLAESGLALQIPRERRLAIEAGHRSSLPELLERIAWEIGLVDVRIRDSGSVLLPDRELYYQEERALIHAIGHSRLLD